MNISSKKRLYFAVVMILAMGCNPMALGASSATQLDREYPIKVGFLYNFMKFTVWPTESVENHDNTSPPRGHAPMTIGIIGKDPFGNAFDVLKDKRVRGRKIVLKRFQGYEAVQQSSKHVEAIQTCHVLFICSAQAEEVGNIIALVKDHAVLTVGETKGFIESGGIINFIQEKKKVRFEVNMIAAKHSKLEISSKLLALAKRIIKQK